MQPAKGQGLLRKEGPPTYATVSQNLVLLQFARSLKGFHRAFNESHLAFGELSTKVRQLDFEEFSTKVSLLSESFQGASFRGAFRKFLEDFQRVFREPSESLISESFRRAFRVLSKSFPKAFG